MVLLQARLKDDEIYEYLLCFFNVRILERFEWMLTSYSNNGIIAIRGLPNNHFSFLENENSNANFKS